MNERIRQLAEQAGLWASEQLPFTNPEWQELKEKKFAELIVEEMYVFMCNATDHDKPWPSFKEVKQHFGVEE